jgi:bud emergence protein 1
LQVIKALYDYSAPDSRYLSFTQGDFLHVVGREEDTSWYEACNPLQGARGLVPATYFETVGKQARNSGGSAKSDPHYIPAGNHDSGYATGSLSSGTTVTNNGVRMSKSMAKGQPGGGAMVYGVVMYDFKAERPDELDAKEGEAIIVIAQSNPEWFVAKPITRLGGPGLIPVSFIEIRDMATNQPVENPEEAVRRAGVPKVEEWKKMAADYKNGSIPLGKLDGGSASLQQSMARMSLGQQGSPQVQQGQMQQANYGNGNGYGAQVRPAEVCPRDANGTQPQQNGSYQSQQYGQQNQNQNPLAPVQATVPRYCFADDTFWFIVVVEMEDGRWWELQRLYQDFYDLQINLITEFPREAGNVKGVERSLPYMPGPVTYVTDNISNGRRANLDEYIRHLLKLSQHIVRGYRVRKFFAPREGDYEIDPAVGDPYRISTGSQHGDVPAGGANAMSPPSSSGFSAPQTSSTFSSAGGYQPASRHGQGQGSQQGATHMRNPSNTGSMAPPPGGMQGQGQGQRHGPGQMGQMGGGQGMRGMAPADSQTMVKIKVFFGPDSIVVIRMPPDFTFADLDKKLRERRKLEPGLADEAANSAIEVSYKDEAEDKLYPIYNDDDLHVAMMRNQKLTLKVRSVG